MMGKRNKPGIEPDRPRHLEPSHQSIFFVDDRGVARKSYRNDARAQFPVPSMLLIGGGLSLAFVAATVLAILFFNQ